MIVYAFSTLGILGKQFFTSPPWYFDSTTSNHMINNDKSLTSVHKFSRNLKIYIIDGNFLPIIATGDVSPSLTDVFISLSLTTSIVSID
jgi:hypothetical protein